MRTGSRNSHWKGGRSNRRDGYTLIYYPGHPKADSRNYVLEHILIAEKALGKHLPPKAVIHHHTPEQPVICQDQAYHMLLHQRQRAFEVCGCASWRKCQYCQQYDDPIKMTVFIKYNRRAYHTKCRNEYRRKGRENGRRT
jgi:hypothetical protein